MIPKKATGPHRGHDCVVAHENEVVGRGVFLAVEKLRAGNVKSLIVDRQMSRTLSGDTVSDWIPTKRTQALNVLVALTAQTLSSSESPGSTTNSPRTRPCILVGIAERLTASVVALHLFSEGADQIIGVDVFLGWRVSTKRGRPLHKKGGLPESGSASMTVRPS